MRDLGGLPIEDGGRTRRGAVVRGDRGWRLTQVGWQAAAAYGIRTAIDLRVTEEVIGDPRVEPLFGVVHVPLFDRPPPRELLFRGETPEEWMADNYLEVYGRRRASVAEAVAAVADAPPGGVVVHCAAGKDRTGMVVALLLRLAGVPVEQIAGDYALSAANVADVMARWVAEAEDEDEREFRRRLGVAPAGAMLRILEVIGDVRGYLRDAGLSESQLEAAAARLHA